jgi:hypothetical protein
VAKKRRVTKAADPVVDKLEQIRRLAILQLISSGVEAKSVAKVLGVSKQTLSGLVPVRAIKKRSA